MFRGGILVKKEDSFLYICSTYYHVYITILKKMNKYPIDSVVICDDIPDGEGLVSRLRECGLFCNVWYVEQSLFPEERGKNRLDWMFFQHKRRAKKIRPLLPFSLGNYESIYIFHDGTPLGMYLMDEKKKYHLLEDALNFYQIILQTNHSEHLVKDGWKKTLRLLFRSGYFPLGASPYLLDIEVNDRENLQIRTKKVIEYPRKDLEKILSEKQKAVLLSVFQFPSLHEGKEEVVALVLTQPLFQDGVLSSREEQWGIYEEIVCFYQEKGCKVWIKAHPRDDMDYTALEIMNVPKNFPAELFQFVRKEPFDYVVTVSSTATVEAREYVKWERMER